MWIFSTRHSKIEKVAEPNDPSDFRPATPTHSLIHGVILQKDLHALPAAGDFCRVSMSKNFVGRERALASGHEGPPRDSQRAWDMAGLGPRIWLGFSVSRKLASIKI